MIQYSMFPRAVAGCSHGISNCMREQPGETLTAQVSIIPAAATCLSYNIKKKKKKKKRKRKKWRSHRGISAGMGVLGMGKMVQGIRNIIGRYKIDRERLRII